MLSDCKEKALSTLDSKNEVISLMTDSDKEVDPTLCTKERFNSLEGRNVVSKSPVLELDLYRTFTKVLEVLKIGLLL